MAIVQVILAAWSSCTPLFLKGYIGGDVNAAERFQACLAAEKTQTLDWGLSQFRNVTGVDIWEGLKKTD